MSQSNDTLDVKISALADFAVELWRLQQWAFKSGFEKERGIARHTARKLGSFLTEKGFELCDLTGQPYDPGLSIEVIDTEHDTDSPAGSISIGEMIAPVVFWRGQVIRAGQVVVYHGTTRDQEVTN
jgi:hypothetical protein